MDHADDNVTNASGNRPFGEILDEHLSRRTVLKGSIATAAMGFFGGGVGAALNASPASAELVTWEGIPTSFADDVVVPPGHVVDILIPWGDPIVSGGPAYNDDASNSAADQEVQIGMGHDGMYYFPLAAGRAGNRTGLLCVNHEFNTDATLFPDGTDDWDAEKTLKSQNSMGVSCVGVGIRNGTWQQIDTVYNRRVNANTPMTMDGPAAGHPLVQTAADPAGMHPLGTINNCSNGHTPWHTYLTCEENFNGYFRDLGEGDLSEEEQELFDRYGIDEVGFGINWAFTDERFRADLNPNEPSRFGWVVEIDPFDPEAKPVKHTAMGRIKHEGATITVGYGRRVVAYMGDDQRFDYIYKFVSAGNWKEMRASGISPLSEGILYVARYNDDGTGEWLPLVHGTGPLTATNGFADQGEVLVKTRLAADALGATPMDRPEWFAVNPRNRDVYCTLTNNTRRGAGDTDAANPRGPNAWGHILKWQEENLNPVSTGPFNWDIFLLAGPGDGADGSTIPADAAFGSPDGLGFDSQGRLWIQTDGGQPDGSNDQMLAADPSTGTIKRFLTGVPGCEVTGLTWTPDERTMFVNLQHPGGTFPDASDPDAISNWPDRGSRPRPATVAIRREDNRRIGTRM